MPLQVNLRHLEEHDVKLQGELPVAELNLEIEDELIRMEKPLRYDLEVQQMEQSLLLQGSLHLTLQCQCVRCLKPFEYQLDLVPWSRHVPLEGEDKAPIDNDCVDLTPLVREDILLEFPQHPLCEADCRGLPKTEVGKSKKTGAPRPSENPPTAWGELDKLKF
jgi:uncharacterized protein